MIDDEVSYTLNLSRNANVLLQRFAAATYPERTLEIDGLDSNGERTNRSFFVGNFAYKAVAGSDTMRVSTKPPKKQPQNLSKALIVFVDFVDSTLLAESDHLMSIHYFKSLPDSLEYHNHPKSSIKR